MKKPDFKDSKTFYKSRNGSDRGKPSYLSKLDNSELFISKLDKAMPFIADKLIELVKGKDARNSLQAMKLILDRVSPSLTRVDVEVSKTAQKKSALSEYFLSKLGAKTP